MLNRTADRWARPGLFGFACALLFSAPAEARSLDEIKESGTIEIVTTSSSPPHGFLDPDTNRLAGVMYEIGDAVADHLGVEASFTEVPFAGLIPTLTSGRADLMSGPLFITEDRAEVVDFTQPVYGWGEGLLVRDDNESEYRSLDALSGEMVGTLADSVQFDMVSEVEGIQGVQTYRDYVSLLLDLRAGRIGVAVVDPPSVAYQIQVHGIEGMRRVDEYQPVNDWEIGLAVAKGNEDLLNSVNEVLDQLKASGRLDEILRDWDIEHLIAD